MRIDNAIANAALIDQMGPELNRLRGATQDVEAVFVKELLGAMQKATPQNDDGDTTGSDVYQDMSNEAFAESAGKSGSLGIGKLLYDRLSPAVVAQARARQLLQVDEPKTENKG